MRKPHLILLRGLPGSGKSTFANYITAGFAANFIDGNQHILVCEADHYFNNNGKYEFVASNIADAHDYCQDCTREALLMGIDVIVSNTSTTEKEVHVYQDMAKEMNAIFVSLIVENRNDTSSVHGVPEETVKKMKDRFTVKL